uniref:protein MAIN-LIKE 1-like n=1 Tax=Erigeron canadensis TaxID=72917 RepID=UPI001CB8A9BF|nr:protein MAIN-LIKE 1-like [Erigeron canadensis]
MVSLNVSRVPRNSELLWLQAPDMHRSYNIFHERKVTMPRCRKSDEGLSGVLKDGQPAKVLQHIKNAGFFQLMKAVIHKLDHPLIIALLERWHLETNTFHFPIGEATVTLQDVQVIWGLPIEGPTVTGELVSETRNVDYWNNLCMEYLGTFPTDEVDRDNLQNDQIKFHALAGRIDFTDFDDDDDEMCLFMARRVILAMIGSELFLDPNAYDVSISLVKNLGDLSKEGRKSWVSAALACFV